jgi:hypothetical protein
MDQTVPGTAASAKIAASSQITFSYANIGGLLTDAKLVRVQVRENKNDRFLFETRVALGSKGTEMYKAELVEVNIQRDGKGVVITPRDTLTPGQYCFVGTKNIGVWCFGII